MTQYNVRKWLDVWERYKSAWREQYPIVDELKVSFHYDRPAYLTTKLDEKGEPLTVTSYSPARTVCSIVRVDKLPDGSDKVHLIAKAEAKQHPTADTFVRSVGREWSFKRAWVEAKKVLGLKRTSIGCKRGI